MRGVALLSCFLACLSLGCTVSVNPLASDNVVEFDEELVGVWVSADNPVEGSKEEPLVITAHGGEYRMEIKDQSMRMVLSAKLVRLGTNRILDVTYAEKPADPPHNFFLIEGMGDSRTVASLDLRKIQQIVKEKEPTLSLAKPSDKWPFTHLDWSTDQLQEFFSRYADAVFVDGEYRESIKKLPPAK